MKSFFCALVLLQMLALHGHVKAADVSCKVLTEFQCADRSKCIPRRWVCDNAPDCEDQSDEAPAINCEAFMTNCTEAEFQCENKKCVPTISLCDGGEDCEDGSDEKHCDAGKCGFSHHVFQCKTTGKCIQKDRVCDDNFNDCDDGDLSDELGCWEYKKCPKHSFACKIDGKMRCKQDSLRCDGNRDCQDVADELGCPPLFENSVYCEAGKFECKNHLCIGVEQLCDGNDDCLDGLDESEEICQAKTTVHQLLQKHLLTN